MLEGKTDVVITVPDAVMQYTVPSEVLSDVTLHVGTGERMSVTQLTSWLNLLGYVRADQVEGEGQYAVRGGIVDVFSPSYPNPFRIDFFGDEIDLIGFFDVTTQRRYENAPSVGILPVYELLPDNLAYENIARNIEKLLKKFTGQEKIREMLAYERESCENHIRINALDKYASFVYDRRETVLDYAKDFLGDNEMYQKWSTGRDGASLIARMLFEEATDINFFVGRAPVKSFAYIFKHQHRSPPPHTFSYWLLFSFFQI